MNELIQYSDIESRLFDLRIGRYNTTSIESDPLVKEIIAGKYDVIRVKTSANDEFASKKLFQTGFPFYFNGGIRRYKVNCLEAPLPPFTHSELSFELYTGQKMDLLFDVMKDSCGDHPIGYYRTPGLDKHITKEMEIKCLFEYYAHYNNHRQFSTNYLWFMKINQEVVGFIALQKYLDFVDSTLAGIYKRFQHQGLFPNILRHIRLFCRDNNITYFHCGARNENLFSQWAFEKDYMKGDGNEYIFHVLPSISKY